MGRSFKNLNYEDRKTIEEMFNQKEKITNIAKRIGCSRDTIYNELKRGGIPYCAETAQKGMKKCKVESNHNEKPNRLEELGTLLGDLKILVDWLSNANEKDKKILLNKIQSSEIKEK